MIHWGFHRQSQAWSHYGWGLASRVAPLTIVRLSWNSHGLWRNGYGGLAEGCLFFAEDVFGNQFCIRGGHVGSFDAETGQVEALAGGLEEWAGLILDDYDLHTGRPVAHHWQKQHGPLPMGKRLGLKRPLALGGDYGMENLYSVDAIEGMRFKADVARQIKCLPDGTRVQFRITESRMTLDEAQTLIVNGCDRGWSMG